MECCGGGRYDQHNEEIVHNQNRCPFCDEVEKRIKAEHERDALAAEVADLKARI